MLLLTDINNRVYTNDFMTNNRFDFNIRFNDKMKTHVSTAEKDGFIDISDMYNGVYSDATIACDDPIDSNGDPQYYYIPNTRYMN